MFLFITRVLLTYLTALFSWKMLLNNPFRVIYSIFYATFSVHTCACFCQCAGFLVYLQFLSTIRAVFCFEFRPGQLNITASHILFPKS